MRKFSIWFRTFLFLLLIAIFSLPLYLSRLDFYISEGSDSLTLIYRHPLWIQLLTLGAMFIFLGLTLWNKGRKSIKANIIGFVLSAFFFILSLQIFVSCGKRRQFIEYYGPIKWNIMDYADEGGVLSVYPSPFYFEIVNEKQDSKWIVLWPYPFRHDIQIIFAGDHEYSLERP